MDRTSIGFLSGNLHSIVQALCKLPVPEVLVYIWAACMYGFLSILTAPAVCSVHRKRTRQRNRRAIHLRTTLSDDVY